MDSPCFSNRMGNGVSNGGGSNGGVPDNNNKSRQWIDYGAIDNSIVEKIRDEDDVRVRLDGVEELHRTVKAMKDLTTLLPQMRAFLTLLDSLLDEQYFKINLLTLEIYYALTERLKSRMKPHVRQIVCSLLKRCGDSKNAVRIETYRVFKRLMLSVAKPNSVLLEVCEHLGDKRASIRESSLNAVMFALLTFPSYEFDLKTLSASVVPALVDPKRRVRQASQECVAILAAFMGPNRAQPLIRAVELLDTHMSKMDGGSGPAIMEAVHSRLSRRQLARVTPDGLVEYSVQIPSSAVARADKMQNLEQQRKVSYGADIDWILAGKKIQKKAATK